MPTANSQQPAWSGAIHHYLLMETAAGRPPTTIKLRRDHLTYMARCIDCPLNEVTSERLITWLGSQPWQRETRRSYRSSLRAFFAYMQHAGILDTNPALDLPPITPQTPAPRPAPDYAWTAARRHATQRVDLMLRLGAEVGLRRSEVALVSTTDLQDGPSLVVHGKGSKQRIVPITDDLAELIARGAAGHTPGASKTGWLFPGDTDGHLNPKRVGALVSAALPDGWTMHTLRHRFATRVYRASRNLRAVQILLGHESIATTQRYLAVDDDEIRAAMASAVA